PRKYRFPRPSLRKDGERFPLPIGRLARPRTKLVSSPNPTALSNLLSLMRSKGSGGAGPTGMSTPGPAKGYQLSQLRRLRQCEQVAAVCYQVRRGGIEFLLVRTNSGHWTFPKGSTEPGLTHAQAAALEAFEEAGVHGRMEEASFTQ